MHEHKSSVTRLAKARLRGWFAGDWKDPWEEVQADRDREMKVRTEKERQEVRIRRARHRALNGYLWDADRTFMHPGMVPLAEPEVQYRSSRRLCMTSTRTQHRCHRLRRGLKRTSNSSSSSGAPW